MSSEHSSMLTNVRKLFKKGASSPSSRERSSSSFSSPSDHSSSSKQRGSSHGSASKSRGRPRTGKDVATTGELGLYSPRENSGPNSHSSNGHVLVPPAATGFDGAYSLINCTKPSPSVHPRTTVGRHVADRKVLQLLGATKDDEGFIAEWMVQASPNGHGSSRHVEADDLQMFVYESSSDDAEKLWPQKSELPPSFEFARPTDKPLVTSQGPRNVADTGTISSPNRQELDLPQTFPFGYANRVYGEDSSVENGTTAVSGEDSSVDSLDAFRRNTRLALPAQPSGQSSPRPGNGYLSPRAPCSPRATSQSPEGRSWGSNGASVGSGSPRWRCSGQPSPERGNRNLHPLPAPPSSSTQPHIHGHANANVQQCTGRTETSNQVATREWQGQQRFGQRVHSPSHHRVPPRLSSHLSPLVSPLPSPPRSPLPSPGRPSFPPAPWSPLPTPPAQYSSHQSPPRSPRTKLASLQNNSSYQSPPRSPSRIPRILTKWKKIKQIGTGTFGTVHEAINLDDGSFFAVKVSRDESIPAEIQKEIEVLRMLRHPNVVQYYGTAMEDGHLCIFLELMQTSLQSIIKAFHHLDETLISTYTRQILQGLEYLHRKNTIHRDIKCANILVDKDGQVKLADFGLAKEVGLSLATSCKGTPYFMAPEILKPNSDKKQRGYGLPVDIWSLGCTVLEMADGEPPWSFLQGYSFFFRLNNGELPPIPQHLSPTCVDFIKSCLRFRPDDRPTASQLLLHPFVANAPATAAAAAFVSPSPAAMFMKRTHQDESQGRDDDDAYESRDRHVDPDAEGSDFQHTRPTLRRSHRLDRSLNRSYSDTRTAIVEMPESVYFSPRSTPTEVASNYAGRHPRW